MSDRYVFGDFEFNNREVILGCFLDTEGSETTLDFRDGKNRDAIQNFIAAHADHVWVAYAAKAEMESLLRLGIDITPMRWIDLMAEAAMITGTHRKMWVPKPNLLNHLNVFEIAHVGDSERKERMRDLILSGGPFGQQEWHEIVRYCWSDVKPLPDLLDAMRLFHQWQGTVWDEDLAVNRGDYLKASAVLEHRSIGLPVDVDWLNRIFENKKVIGGALAEGCNQHYGASIYRVDRVTSTYTKSG